jgi:hypothetical protein
LVFDQFISKYAASFNRSQNTTFNSNPLRAGRATPTMKD